MFSLAELNNRIAVYVDGTESFDVFVDWYRRNSRGKFGAPADVLNACVKIDSALSAFYFDGESEELLRTELANAIHPFAPFAVARSPRLEALREVEPSAQFQTRISFDVIQRKVAAGADSSSDSRSTLVPEEWRLSATA